MFRLDLFSPKQIPLVFNRKTRKVYRAVLQLPERDWSSVKALVKYWASAFAPWPPMLLVEYDWDCLEAEYFERSSLIGNVVKTFHVLQLYVKAAPASEQVIGSFALASPLTSSRDSALALWEFIRRYMEEDGAALYPGDQAAPALPRNLLQAANTVSPAWPLALIGAWWSTRQYLALGLEANFWVFLVALLSDALLLAILFNWIAHRFGRDMALPAHCLAEAGAPLDLQQLALAASGSTPSSAAPSRARTPR